jgi:hypothetical protein
MSFSKQKVEIVTNDKVNRPYGPMHKKYKARSLLILTHDYYPINFTASSRTERYMHSMFVLGEPGGNFFCFCNKELDKYSTSLDDGYLADYRHTYQRKTKTVISMQKPRDNRYWGTPSEAPTLQNSVIMNLITRGTNQEDLSPHVIPRNILQDWIPIQKRDLKIRKRDSNEFSTCNDPNHTWENRCWEKK